MLDRLLHNARTRLATRRRPYPRTAHRPSDPGGTPPTVQDLEAAGVVWEPLDDDEASGLEIARDNGYVVLRDPSAPGRPPLVLDEAEWDAAIEGDDTYDPDREWLF